MSSIKRSVWAWCRGMAIHLVSCGFVVAWRVGGRSFAHRYVRMFDPVLAWFGLPVKPL